MPDCSNYYSKTYETAVNCDHSYAQHLKSGFVEILLLFFLSLVKSSTLILNLLSCNSVPSPVESTLLCAFHNKAKTSMFITYPDHAYLIPIIERRVAFRKLQVMFIRHSIVSLFALLLRIFLMHIHNVQKLLLFTVHTISTLFIASTRYTSTSNARGPVCMLPSVRSTILSSLNDS